MNNGPVKTDVVEAEGVILESLPNTTFRVQLDETAPELVAGKTILATISGKMRLYRIKVLPGDRVRCEISRYDTSKGRITFRGK